MNLKTLAYLSLGIALLTVIFTVSLAMAATPMKVIITGSGLKRAIEIIDAHDLSILVGKLCSEQHADNLAGRSGLDVAIQWTENPNEMTWRRHFYPATDDQAAAIDIPDWKLYTSGEETLLCNHRIVGPEALKVLSKYEVPILVRPPSRFPIGLTPSTILSGLILILAVLALSLIAYRFSLGKRKDH